jgi:hypothetical protein
LRRVYKDTAVPVTSIFIQNDVPNDHTSLIEDIVASIYYQLRNRAPNLDGKSSQLAFAYETACQIGEASSRRLNLLRQALQAQLATNDHSFLILDGYDRLGTALRTLLDYELQDSHRHRLSVLITRRTPVYQPPIVDGFGCDGCFTEGLKLYFKCPEPNCEFALCYECMEKQLKCDQDGHKLSLLEPYPQIDMDITRPNETVRVNGNHHDRSLLEQFVSRELENEYGDLGLTRRASDGSGPIVASASPSDVAYGRKLLKFAMDEPDKNINLTKLRLDEVYTMDSSSDFEEVSDRLPRGIVSFFDSEIERIKQSNLAQCNTGLMAIVAVAGCEKPLGMPIHELEHQIREERLNDLHKAFPPARSLEDILFACNGLLVLQPHNDVVRVALYHSDFTSYVRDDYNEFLFQAKAKLRTAEKVDRDAAEPERILSLAHTTASPPTMSQEFKRPSDNASRTSSIDSAYFSRNSSLNMSLGTSTVATNHSSQSSPINKVMRMSGGPNNRPLSRPSLHTRPLGISCGEVLDIESISESSHPHENNDSALCNFCRDVVLGSREVKGDHYSSLDSVRKAVADHCTFCAKLYVDVLEQSTKEQIKSLMWPLYKWTMRSSGRLNNNKGSIAVSFKPTKHKSVTSTLHIRLPTQKYHLLLETELGYIPTEPELGNTTRPPASTDSQIKRWVNDCVENHPGCRKAVSDIFVPTRLLDLNLIDSNYIRVVETEPNNIKGPYVTLSHCWGKALLLTLTRENEARLKKVGAHMNDLPLNFQEAIIVARELKMRYIWIDSLCICQGKGGDFATEGQLMHKVYRYSYCNIAIADSSDSRGGIFRKRKPSSIIPSKLSTSATSKLGEATWRILPSDIWTSSLLGSKIYTRGWVFQERMLSPRILHFAHDQIFWDCCTLSATETLPTGLPHVLDSLASTDRHWRGRIQSVTYPQSVPVVGEKDDSMEKFWKTSVANYTNCDLTNQEDKTFAIWSIAKIVRDVLDEEYGGGLWEFGLEEQLAWQVKDCKKDMRLVDLESRWPSWTWASIKGAVNTHDRIISFQRSYTVLNHQGGPISFSVTQDKSNRARGDARNNEPILLDPRSIEMSGYIGRGLIRAGRTSGAYRIGVSRGDTSAPDREVQGLGMEIFDVFPDEILPESTLYPNECAFIVLAVSEHRPPRPKIPTPVNSASSNSSQSRIPTVTNSTSVALPRPKAPTPMSSTSTVAIARRPTLPKNVSFETGMSASAVAPENVKVMYSGIGLLVIPHATYLDQQKQKLQELSDLIANWSETEPDPPHPSDKKLAARLADLGKWVRELEDRTIRYGQELHYHRVGVIQFRDVNVDMWEAIKGDGKVKFWLD